jgi:hypothetical protein
VINPKLRTFAPMTRSSLWNQSRCSRVFGHTLRMAARRQKTSAPRRRAGAVLAIVITTLIAPASGAFARESGDAIQLQWMEGDVAGMTTIWSPGGAKVIGFVEYHQQRQGDRLEATRVARFADGSSDEDQVEAHVGSTLEAMRGRSIIRDQRGASIVDLTIDVPRGRITGFSGVGEDRETYDEKVELPAGTYWGPLIFIVVKNFDRNATDDRLVFRTVAPTPKPRVIDMELIRDGLTAVTSPGGKLDVVLLSLRPTINWLVNPIVHRIAPSTRFFMQPGTPPALARFEGPRNYTGQEIRLE